MIRLGRGATMLLGGARSGKSDLAVRLAEAWPGDTTFVATAEAGDADMARRIDRHRDDRPASWGLLERPLFSADDLGEIDAEHLVIIDCITMLVANQLFAEHSPEQIRIAAEELGRVASARHAPTLIVSNEVGLGVHPETEMGRAYRDLLGRTNRALAGHAETTLLVVAGRAVELEEIDPRW